MSLATPMLEHPCFDKTAHFEVGRIHLPVAPKCNAGCRYCGRGLSKTIDRPGVAAAVIGPLEALVRTREALAANPAIKVVGIAGPGDALANNATFDTLSLIHREFPLAQKCLSTNGLLLAERIDDLIAVGVSSVTVTVNAIDPEIGRRFYNHIFLDGRVIRGEDAFTILNARQLSGIGAASERGLNVKVNSVLVPELNGAHLTDVAREVQAKGASLMNITPLKPLSGMSDYRAPDCSELEAVRADCEKYLPQFKLCRQCRADAVGIPGHGDSVLPVGVEPRSHATTPAQP